MNGRKRTLTESEARWEAVNLIHAAVTDFLGGGAVPARGETQGWTMADMLAIERHARDRVDGLIRRPRKGATDGG